LLAGKDRTINPDLERWYATRANSRKVEVSGASHAVHVSRPKEVAALIEDAARMVRSRAIGKILFHGSDALDLTASQLVWSEKQFSRFLKTLAPVT
jgi:hypothetical protein